MQRLLTAVVAFAFAIGCGGESHDHENHAHENHANHGTATNNAGDVDTYSDGLMKMGAEGEVMVMLMTADPAPPDVGDNTWTLRIVDMDENPIDGATVTVTPFMHAHGHGTTPADFDAKFSQDGTYEVGPIDLFMPGVWETTITVDTGDATDEVKYTFELEG